MHEVLSWTDERVEQLKELWLLGLSASQCARELGGGATRSSVIGKVYRMGWSRDHAEMRRTTGAPRSRVPRKVFKPVVIPKDIPLAIGPLNQFADRKTCQYIHGDPLHTDWQMCGQSASKWPYCDYHRYITVDHSKPRPDKERAKADGGQTRTMKYAGLA